MVSLVGKELNSLSSILDKELVQMVDRCLDSPDHVLQPISATCQLLQVGVVISFSDHQLFSWTVLLDLLSTIVIQVWLSVVLLGRISRWWRQAKMLSLRPSSPCHFG